jgi:hypothetical protein
VVFTLAFLGSILAAVIAIVVVASMHAPDTAPDQPAEPPLPDGNSRGDDLLMWAAEHPDRACAPEYMEDQ